MSIKTRLKVSSICWGFFYNQAHKKHKDRAFNHIYGGKKKTRIFPQVQRITSMKWKSCSVLLWDMIQHLRQLNDLSTDCWPTDQVKPIASAWLHTTDNHLHVNIHTSRHIFLWSWIHSLLQHHIDRTASTANCLASIYDGHNHTLAMVLKQVSWPLLTFKMTYQYLL